MRKAILDNAAIIALNIASLSDAEEIIRSLSAFKSLARLFVEVFDWKTSLGYTLAMRMQEHDDLRKYIPLNIIGEYISTFKDNDDIINALEYFDFDDTVWTSFAGDYNWNTVTGLELMDIIAETNAEGLLAIPVEYLKIYPWVQKAREIHSDYLLEIHHLVT